MEQVEFVKTFCGGRLELPLREAAALAGLNERTIKNDALSAKRKAPVFPLIKRGGRLYVSSLALHRYFFPEAVQAKRPATEDSPKPSLMRRGAPTLEERRQAAAKGMTVPELRRSVIKKD